MGLAWKQKPLRQAARAEIISLMVCVGGVHGPGEGLTWLENFKRRHSWLAVLIAWPALMLRAMPDRWDVAVKCASVPPATLCARPSALTYELLLRFNDVCVKFVGEDKTPSEEDRSKRRRKEGGGEEEKLEASQIHPPPELDPF